VPLVKVPPLISTKSDKLLIYNLGPFGFCSNIQAQNCLAASQGRRQKILQGGGATEKRPKISKKYRKIALFGLFQGGG